MDRPTADALVAAFRRFEADKLARVAILTGAGGTFCAGADLKAMGNAETMNHVSTVASGDDGPMGPTRMVRCCAAVGVQPEIA